MDKDKVKKRWPPIENNPEVLSALSHTLGLSADLEFHDVYSLDDPEVLAFLPRPVLSLVLVFPVTEAYERYRVKEDAGRSNHDGEDGAVWIQQTIGNACGTMAILHTLANLPDSALTPESEFGDLLRVLKGQTQRDRTRSIEESTLVEEAHLSVAQQGQSRPIAADEKVLLHFAAFVKSPADGCLYELDGRRKGPISHGKLEESEDVLNRGLQVIQEIIKGAGAEIQDGEEEDFSFSLCALA